MVNYCVCGGCTSTGLSGHRVHKFPNKKKDGAVLGLGAFCAVSISCSRSKRSPQEALQLLSSARLSLKSLITKARQLYTDVATDELRDDLRDDVTELEQLVTELQDLSAQLRSQ